MEDVGIFYGHLVQFTAFCYILWTFGIVRGNLVYISQFWYSCTKKNLATLMRTITPPPSRRNRGLICLKYLHTYSDIEN
jgi:hypothetical protein